MKREALQAKPHAPGEVPAVLVYDGGCPACTRAVEWVKRNARPGAFEFLSCHSRELAGRFPSIDKGACLAAMHLVLPGGTALPGGRAAPEIVSRLTHFGWLGRLLRFPGVLVLLRLLYRPLARRRHVLSRILFPAG